MNACDNSYDKMKMLSDELIELSDKNGLACLISFETKLPDTCYVSFTGTTDQIGYTVNFMERSLEGKTHYSMRAIKEKGYQYAYYQQKKTDSPASKNRSEVNY